MEDGGRWRGLGGAVEGLWRMEKDGGALEELWRACGGWRRMEELWRGRGGWRGLGGAVEELWRMEVALIFLSSKTRSVNIISTGPKLIHIYFNVELMLRA